MATNTNLGGVFTTDIDGKRNSNVFLSTENVVGLIFDTSIVGGLEKALGKDTLAAQTFANGNVVELNTTKDVADAGIDDTVLAGIAKYHLDSFFSLAGGTQRIFVSFMNSDEAAHPGKGQAPRGSVLPRQQRLGGPAQLLPGPGGLLHQAHRGKPGLGAGGHLRR